MSNKSLPDFGIVVPIGPGHRPWLLQTLKSLACQDVDIRIAICAVEDSPHLQASLGPYQDLIDYVRCAPDAGQSAAINEGWAALNTRHYGWLNDDDMLHPTALPTVLKAFKTMQADVVHGRTDIIEGNRLRVGYGQQVSEASLLHENRIAQPSTFVKRQALKDLCPTQVLHPVDENMHFAMDWDLWQRLFLNGAKFHAISDPLSITRWYPETKTASFNLRKYREYAQLLKRGKAGPRLVFTLLNMAIHNQASYGNASKVFSPLKTGLSKFGKSNQELINNQPTNLDIFHFGEMPIQFSHDGQSVSLPAGEVFTLDQPSVALKNFDA